KRRSLPFPSPYLATGVPSQPHTGVSQILSWQQPMTIHTVSFVGGKHQAVCQPPGGWFLGSALP
ncbi:MAG: hypothetical protein ACUVXB_16905, partial [Bryobacteraceae bacterium]